MTPVLSDIQVKDTVNKYKKILEGKDSEIVHQEKWKLRKLAYPIEHKKMGIYQIVQFKSTPELIKNLETEYGRDERIMRFLTVSLDKIGVEYNVNKRKIDAKRLKTEKLESEDKKESKEKESKSVKEVPSEKPEPESGKSNQDKTSKEEA